MVSETTAKQQELPQLGEADSVQIRVISVNPRKELQRAAPLNYCFYCLFFYISLFHSRNINKGCVIIPGPGLLIVLGV